MKQRLFYFLFAWLVMRVSSVCAQGISGRLVDERKQSVEFANIVLYSLPDSTFVQGTTSDENGQFRLAADCDGGLLRISCLGYQTLYLPCVGNQVGTLQLSADALLLDEVVVRAEPPKIRVRGDALQTTVAGTLLEKAGTAEDLLDKIPGLSAGGGTVSVFGRGSAEVYINGRKVRDGAELDQLSSANIKSVEVVRNPGARYAATVKAVVRIVTKKPVGEGFGFNNRFLTAYNKEWSVLDQFNFNFRRQGFDLSGTLLGSDNRDWSKKALTQDTYLDQLWTQQMQLSEKEHSQTLSATLSMNYVFNSRHSAGVRYNFRRMPRYDSWGPLESEVSRDGSLEEQLWSDNEGGMQQSRHTLNLYYKGKSGDWTVDFNADALWRNQCQDGMTNETSLLPDGMKEQREVTSVTDMDGKLYAAKLVLSRPLWGGELAFGGEYSYTSYGNDYRNLQHILSDYANEIKENSASAFLEYSRSWGKLEAQAGVRFEHISSDYYQQGVHVDGQSRNYDNWFPSVSFSWPIGQVQAQLAYAADIERPSYHQLRGNTVYNNRYTYESGNPFLQPQLTHNVTLNLVRKWVLLTAGYLHLCDPITSSCESYSEENPAIALLSTVNGSDYDKVYASLTLSPTIGIWSPQFSAGIARQWYVVDTPWGSKHLDSPIGSLSWDNSLSLPGGFLLSVNASWSSCGYSDNMQQKRDVWEVDMVLFKSFLKKKLTLQLRADDLFNSTRSRYMIYYGALRTMDFDVTPTLRRVALTVRYSFNSTRSKYKGTGAGSGQKERF